MAGGIPQNLLANLSVRLGMDTKAFDLGTKQASKNLSSFKSGLAGVKALFVAGFGAAAINAMQKFANEAKEMYKIAAAGEIKLQTVMRERMNASDEMIESVKNLVSEQKKLGIIDDEVQISGAQQLATFLRQKDALEKLIPAMNNLIAQQKGYDAEVQDAVNVANMMGKVLDGSVGALRRVGITFTETQEKMLKSGDEMQRAATLAQVITDNVGNMNEELAKTDLGKLTQLEQKLSDIKEEIGGKLMPAFIAFAKVKAWVLGIDINDEKTKSEFEAFKYQVENSTKEQVMAMKITWQREYDKYFDMWKMAKDAEDAETRKYNSLQMDYARDYLEYIEPAKRRGSRQPVDKVLIQRSLHCA